jgi:hypothetical protein
MIGLFFSVLSIVFIILHYFQNKKRENITWHIWQGGVCYKCKTDINGDRFWGEDAKIKLCKSCER